MNNKTVLSVVLAVALASSGLAFGQGNGGRDERGNEGGDRGRNEQSQRGGQPGGRDNKQAQPQRHNEGGHANNDQRGAGPNNAWQRGDRLPKQYRGNQYVVDDWRGHNLSAPPRGYHWVQNGGDYILVAIATGVIMQLLLNH